MSDRCIRLGNQPRGASYSDSESPDYDKKPFFEQGTPIDEAKEYCRSAKNWLEQIRVLMKEEQPAKAQTEYDLFCRAFPYAPDFTLDSAPE